MVQWLSLLLISCSVVSNSVTPMDHSMQAFPVFHYLPELFKLMFIESMMPSNHLILCCPFLLLPLIFPSIRVSANKLVLHIRWPKYWSFSFSISLSNKHSGLIFFRIVWFDFFAVQGALKSLLHHHNSKASAELSRTLGGRRRSGGCPSCAQQRAPSRYSTPASARSPAVENVERNHLL